MFSADRPAAKHRNVSVGSRLVFIVGWVDAAQVRPARSLLVVVDLPRAEPAAVPGESDADLGVSADAPGPNRISIASKALELLDGSQGREGLAHLRAMTSRFERGVVDLAYETIPGPHPIVPPLVRDSQRTAALVTHLRDRGILATGLAYPVVPLGEEDIRFQISADHTAADIDEVLAALASFAS
jgi:hypothetical protein